MSFIYIVSYLSMFYPLSIYILLSLSNLIFKIISERRYTSPPVKNNLFSEVTQLSDTHKTPSISNHLKINNHDVLSNSNDYQYAIVDTNAINERIIKIKGIFVNNVFYSNEFIKRDGDGSPKSGKLSFMKIFEDKKEDSQLIEKAYGDSVMTFKQSKTMHLEVLNPQNIKSPVEISSPGQRIHRHISFSYISNLIRDEKELNNKHEMFKAMCLCHFTQSKRTENKKIEDENVFHYMTEDDEKILNFAKINNYVFKSVVYNKDNTYHCKNIKTFLFIFNFTLPF